MNRHDRRQRAKLAGLDWFDLQRRRRLERSAGRLEGAALRMTPEQARAQLARWAAQPGHSQAEVDRLNGVANDKYPESIQG